MGSDSSEHRAIKIISDEVEDILDSDGDID